MTTMTPEEISFQRSRRIQAQQWTVIWLRAEIERLKNAQTDYSKGKYKALTSALRMLDVEGAWIADSRTTTNHRDEMEKQDKVQCADCWAWIKRDESHTCKQQIKRNQKHARGTK